MTTCITKYSGNLIGGWPNVDAGTRAVWFPTSTPHDDSVQPTANATTTTMTRREKSRGPPGKKQDHKLSDTLLQAATSALRPISRDQLPD